MTAHSYPPVSRLDSQAGLQTSRAGIPTARLAASQQHDREVAAKALRDVADAMDNGDIEHDSLKYDTTEAPKGWLDQCVWEAWESMSIWAPWLRNRADGIEAGR